MKHLCFNKYVLFFHPDYTVGIGISLTETEITDSAAYQAGRGLYRRLGLTPDPEDLIPFTHINITHYKCICK